MDKVNLQILDLINQRANIVQEIGKLKTKQSIKRFDPVREREMLDNIKNNNGPFQDSTIEHIFKEIFKASLELQEDNSKALLVLVSRKKQPESTVVNLKGEKGGNGGISYVFDPCAVEGYEQVAASVKEKGLKLLRGDAFKPRTSPYDFQGLGIEGLEILKKLTQPV